VNPGVALGGQAAWEGWIIDSAVLMTKQTKYVLEKQADLFKIPSPSPRRASNGPSGSQGK
jgi:hypothetical protein